MTTKKDLMDQLGILAKRRGIPTSDLLEEIIRREIDGDAAMPNPFSYEDGVRDAAEIVRDGMKQHHWYNHILKKLGVTPRVERG